MTGPAIAEFTGRFSKPVILGAELSLNKLPRLVGRLTYTLIQKFFKLLLYCLISAWVTQRTLF